MKSIFTSHQTFLNGDCAHNVPVDSEVNVEKIIPLLTNSATLKPLLYQLVSITTGNRKETGLTVDLLDRLFPLLNDSDKEIVSCAYIIIEFITDQMDPDELVEHMMDQLICISWEFENGVECIGIAKLSSMFVSLFGKGLEKMNRARDWMLFIPFLANYLVKTLDIIEFILVEKSMYCTVEKKRDEWEDVIDLFAGSCLDFIEFIHTRTVAQTPTEFPIHTTDIGLENGDVKRRYLGYYLLNLIYERILLNFNMQLSKTYFEKFHTMYNFKRPNQSTSQVSNKHMLDIVQRSMELSSTFGFSTDRMVTLLQCLKTKDHSDLSLEDRISDDDRQMINFRMYPLSYRGIGALISFSVYDKILVHTVPCTDALLFAKKYIGIMLTLLSGSNSCQVDKGIFVLLYLSDEIKTTVTMEDMEKPIDGPDSVFPASQIIEVISSVASTNADASHRFLSYKLIEKFLNFGDDETRVFFLTELLDRCPFPCMKTASIGLLKDQIDQAFKKGFSIFTSPLIMTKFFPIVFQSNWNKESFWDDYNHVMQALNIYFYLLIKDEPCNLTTIWNQENIDLMQDTYLNPLVELLEHVKTNDEIDFQDMQVDMMKNVIHKILKEISNNVQ